MFFLTYYSLRTLHPYLNIHSSTSYSLHRSAQSYNVFHADFQSGRSDCCSCRRYTHSNRLPWRCFQTLECWRIGCTGSNYQSNQAYMSPVEDRLCTRRRSSIEHRRDHCIRRGLQSPSRLLVRWPMRRPWQKKRGSFGSACWRFGSLRCCKC